MKGFKRKKQGRTDYKQRLRFVNSGKTRLVVRKTNKNIIVQFIDYSPKGDIVKVSGHTNELKKYGWKGSTRNSYCAYLTGFLVGLKAKKQGISNAILDIGLNKTIKGSILYAALKGSLDSGISVPHSEEILPSERRIKGEHTTNYAKKIGENKSKIFSYYLENKINPEEIPNIFEKIKQKIIEKWQ